MLELSPKSTFSLGPYPNRTWVEEPIVIAKEACGDFDFEISSESVKVCYTPLIKTYEESIIKSFKRRDAKFVWNNRYIGTIQNSLKQNDRDQIVKFIITNGNECSLTLRSISLAIKILDSVLQKVPIPRESLNVVACASLFIAGKHEGCDMDDVCTYLASKLIDQNETVIIKMELQILNILRFDVDYITPLNFLEFYLRKEDYLEKLEEFSTIKKIAKAVIMECLANESLNNYNSEAIALCSIEIAKNIFKCHQITVENKNWNDILIILKHALDDDNSILNSLLPFHFDLTNC